MLYRKSTRYGALSLLILLLSACGGSDKHQDLRDYMEETMRRPAGQIEPLPPFVPYQSFSYSAMAMRSPFEPPVDDMEQMRQGRKSSVKPDQNREKEFLENFNIASLKMVGTLQRRGTLWALIDDGAGGIHRVKQGNYLGKNHGQIKEVKPRQVEVNEIVPDGTDGWVERPQVLQIAEKE